MEKYSANVQKALYTVDSPMLQQLKKTLNNICSACSY